MKPFIIPAHLAVLNKSIVETGTVKIERAKPVLSTHVTTLAGDIVRVRFSGLRLVSEANARERVRVRVARVMRERKLVTDALRGVTLPSAPVVVELVRRGPRALDASDNLRVSGKHLADAIAACLGVDDGDPDRFCYSAHQELAPRVYEVVVYIHRPAPPIDCPWHLTYYAIDTWMKFHPELDWPGARASLASVAQGVMETDETTVDGKHIYVHPSHPATRFVVAHDLDTHSKTLVTIHVTRPAPPKKRIARSRRGR